LPASCNHTTLGLPQGVVSLVLGRSDHGSIEPSFEGATMNDCILCGHPHEDHHDGGCRGRSRLLAACSCTYAEPEPLAAVAGAEEHRARSDWWDLHARTSWESALRARHDLDRWHPLMRFHRLARQAEIDHRRYALSLDRPGSLGVAPVPAATPQLLMAGELPQPPMSFARRMELAAIA
jgi:hypothetical protein